MLDRMAEGKKFLPVQVTTMRRDPSCAVYLSDLPVTCSVSMDTSTLAQNVESVERNIEFLQKEHQVLLTGLRLEILHLKKRCNDLSCELSKSSPARNKDEIASEEEFLQARLLQTEHYLAEQVCLQEELKSQLRHKGEQASALQVRLRNEERRFLEELKRRSHNITTLSRDLRKQTDVAANLTFQLHSARFRLYHQAVEEDEYEEGERVEEGPDCVSSSSQFSTATAEARHHSQYSARLRRSERVRECVPQERVLGPEKPCSMPDPGLFLYPFRQRLLPLRLSLRGHCVEGDAQSQMGKLQSRSMREDTGQESTDL